jgi:hypothetical protein
VEVNVMAVVGEDVPRPVVVGGASWVGEDKERDENIKQSLTCGHCNYLEKCAIVKLLGR